MKRIVIIVSILGSGISGCATDAPLPDAGQAPPSDLANALPSKQAEADSIRTAHKELERLTGPAKEEI